MSDSPDVDQYSVADAPSVGANPNANPGSFKVPTNWIYQTIAPSGAITKDQVFTTATTDEVIPPEAIKNYSSYLVLSNKVRPVTSLSETDFSINQQYVDEAKKRRDKALSLISGTSFTEEDLIVTAKSSTTSFPVDFTPTEPTTTSPTFVSKDFIGLPVTAGVYKYITAELYDDRYDFETGKKIRVGIASGVGGGQGDITTKGNTTSTVEQTESPSNTNSETPVVGKEEDPCG